MIGLITCRKFFSRILVRLDEPVTSGNPSSLVGLGYFVIGRFAFAFVWLAMFLLEIPLHLFRHTTDSFSAAALQGPQHEFQESYSSFVRRQHLAVVSVLASFLFLIVQLTFLGYSVVQFTIPTKVTAQSGSVDIFPTWDAEGIRTKMWSDVNPCSVLSTTYSGASAGATTMTFGQDQADPTDCSIVFEYQTLERDIGMKFSLSSIPNTATITGVTLNVNVSNSSTQTVQIKRATTDAIDTASQTNSSFMDAIETGTSYATDTWSSTGAKSVSLGGTAVSEVQSRITGSDILPLGIYTVTTAGNDGVIAAVDHATPANRPYIRVTYTLPPSAPTGFTRTSSTTTTLSWQWTDTTSGETRYDVHDSSHAPVTGCTALAANSTTCTETGLSANTQYTRHANVTDAEGNADSTTTTSYTAIQTPSLSFTPQIDSIQVSGGTLSNIASGSSGFYFDNVTLDNNFWTQSTSYEDIELNPNAPYQYRGKARNGDGVETAFTSIATVYTLPIIPSVTHGDDGDWHNTPTYVFSSTFDIGGASTSGTYHYLRYVWDQNPTYVFSNTESTWSTNASYCPGGVCDITGTLSVPATTDGNWYLHLRSYNGDGLPGTADLDTGPFRFDGSAPTAPVAVRDGSAADISTQTSTTSLEANWDVSTDTSSGLDHYEYAIGTTSGGTDVRSFTTTGSTPSVNATGLTLAVGATYYFSVRAIDLAGNISAVTTANGVSVVASSSPSMPPPTIADTTRPTVAAIVTDATTTTATIRWTTSEATTAKVEYGLSAAYGSSVERTTFVTEHQLALTGLSPSTTYHFRIVATDASENATITSDDTLTTVATIRRDGITGPTLLRPVVRGGSAPSITITGVGKGNQTITIYVNDKVVKTVQLSGQLQETKSFAVKLLAAIRPTGKYTVTATSTQSDGRVSEIRQQLTFRIQADETGKYVRPNVTSTYIVHAGDSLWSIAARMLGDGIRWTEIQTANSGTYPSLVTAPTILPGWALTIPAP